MSTRVIFETTQQISMQFVFWGSPLKSVDQIWFWFMSYQFNSYLTRSQNRTLSNFPKLSV